MDETDDGSFCLPARRKVELARPLQLDGETTVLCHTYPLDADRSESPVPGKAHLCFFLPHNWAASYKFTVFEGSYIVAFFSSRGEASTNLYLARPLETNKVTAQVDAALPLPEFELVWPIPLDRALLDAVRHACERTQLGCKRKPHDPSLSSVHQKLRRLGL